MIVLNISFVIVIIIVIIISYPSKPFNSLHCFYFAKARNALDINNATTPRTQRQL